MSDSNLSDIISSSLTKIREFADAETVIGKTIHLSCGTEIIPVSKVSMGFASGGLDYPTKGEISTKQRKGFGGGGGTGVTVSPVCFLIADKDGKVDIVPVVSAKNIGTVDKIASLIERSPDILSELRDVLTPESVKETRAAERTRERQM